MAAPVVANPKHGFSASTASAYHLKVLSDLLKSNLKEENARVNKKGIFIRGADEKEKTLIDVELHASALNMEPPETEVEVGIVFSHLHEVMRRIKRKDSLHISRAEGSDQLEFNILNAEKGRDKDAFIRLKEIKSAPWDIPDYPEQVVCTIPASEFQRMTKENSKSKYMTIKIQERGVKFVAGTPQQPQLSGMGDRYGKYKDGEEDLYCRVFETKQLTKLAKVNGLATNNFLKLSWLDNEQPIMLESAIDLIGRLRILLSPMPPGQVPSAGAQ
jgi:proliferating cell nuclear antigen